LNGLFHRRAKEVEDSNGHKLERNQKQQHPHVPESQSRLED